MSDKIDSPSHYTQLPVECIDVAEHFNYCLGNALKYIWRADYKGNPLEDLKKARWYIDREIKSREESGFEESLFEELTTFPGATDWENPFGNNTPHGGNMVGGWKEAVRGPDGDFWIKHDGSNVNPVPDTRIKVIQEGEPWGTAYQEVPVYSNEEDWMCVTHYKVVGDE